MLPKHKAAPRLQQFPHLPHHTLWIAHRTQYLNAQNGIHTPLGDPLTSQDIAVLNTTYYELVLILEIKFIDLCSDCIFIVWVGVNGVYEVYEGWIIAMELVAWAGAKIEDLAFSGANKGRDTGRVFIGDEAAGWARELACMGFDQGEGGYK